MVEEEGHLLLLGEAVEGACLEVVEGIVCWGQEGETLVRVVELVFDLGAHLGGAQKAH